MVCQTPGEGPPAIEDQSDVEAAIKSLCRSIAAQDSRGLRNRLVR